MYGIKKGGRADENNLQNCIRPGCQFKKRNPGRKKALRDFL
jgi:hypothetical protein